MDTSFFDVQPLQNKTFTTQQDHEASMCKKLAKYLRSRPTLPADPEDTSRSWEDLKTGIALPEVSCSFQGCFWHGETDTALESHVVSYHAASFTETCGDDDTVWFDMYLGAISSIERNQVPAVGLAKDRQVLRKLTKHRYNDEHICSQELSNRVARAWLVCQSAQRFENFGRELRMGSLVQAIRRQAAFERIWARSVQRRASEGLVLGDRHVPSKQPLINYIF